MKKSSIDPDDISISFRIKKSHDDDKIRELFSDCITNKERADLTKIALNFYVDNKDKFDDIKELKKNMEKVISKLDDLKSSGIQVKNIDGMGSNTNEEDTESKEVKDKWSEGALKMFKF